MYKQKLEHKVKFETINDLPKITIGIKFNDYFTKDVYALVSETLKNYNPKKIPFLVFKNNKKIGCVTFNDNKNFLNEAFQEIQDYDFHDFFNDEIKKSILEEMEFYISQYEKQIVLNEISLNGELHRMKELSGMKKRYLA